MNGQAGWNVIMTRARREQGAASRLRDQGFDVFLPCFRRAEKRAGERNGVLVALFPGYLFTAASERIWGAGRIVPEIVMVLPQTVPDQALAHLKAVNEAPAVNGHEPIDFELGARLRITDGPFIGLIGNLRSTDPLKRLAVLDVLLGTVSVDLANVRLAR